MQPDPRAQEALAQSAKVAQQNIELEMSEIKKIQKELNNLLTGRQDYIQKKSENEMVLKEFMLLSEGASIYKMIGPVLAKQEIVEAKGNVQKRLDYINAEVSRIDKIAKDFESKMDEKKKKVLGIQEKFKAELAKQQEKAQMAHQAMLAHNANAAAAKQPPV